MSGCTGQCREREYRYKKDRAERIVMQVNENVRVIPGENESQQEAEQRCRDAVRPTADEREAAARRVLAQYPETERQVCSAEGDETGGRCKCLFGRWGEFLPEDESRVVDGQTVTEEKWEARRIHATFERGNCKFRVWGHVQVKVRERFGICLDKELHEKVAYIPEWGVDLDDERIANLSEASREKILAKLG